MTSKTKKVLSILVSTTILAGFTADVALNSNPITVNATKHHKKKSHKKQTKKQKAKVKNSSNDNKTTSQSSNQQANANVIEPQNKYSSLADWYVANAQRVFNKYSTYGSQPNDDFHAGISDGITEGGLTVSQYSNEMYKEGWIIQYVFGDGAPFSENIYQNIPLKQAYENAIQIYDAAAPAVQNAKYNRIFYAGTIANPDGSAWQNQ